MTLATFISLTIPSAAGAENSAPGFAASSTSREVASKEGSGAVSPGRESKGILETPAASEQVARPDVTRRGCANGRRGLAFYRQRYSTHLAKRGVRVEFARKPRNCPDARYLAARWRSKAYQARLALERFQERRYVLRDFRVAPGSNAWRRAVREAQGPFPGTEAWLLSCSASEGGHGRWVVYGGGSYYPGYEYTDAVGGHLQFRPSTFRGFFRHAVEDVQRRGYRTPQYATWLHAWRSALGQALAGAWGISHGMRSHWAGAGCW